MYLHCGSAQGETDDELPEVMLGVVRVRKLDVLLADNLGASEDLEVNTLVVVVVVTAAVEGLLLIHRYNSFAPIMSPPLLRETTCVSFT